MFNNSKLLIKSKGNYFWIVSIIMSVAVVFCNETANALPVDRFWSVLETNPLKEQKTFANGFIGIKFREDFKQLVYNVNVNNIDNITGIYLYSRPDDAKKATMILDLLQEAREVKVKDIFQESNSLLNKKHEIQGTVAVGGVTSTDLQGVLEGKSLKALHRMVTAGDTYVVVTTKQFPLGEIGGGDFIPIDRFFPDISDFQWN